jgi:hypothetical protein
VEWPITRYSKKSQLRTCRRAPCFRWRGSLQDGGRLERSTDNAAYWCRLGRQARITIPKHTCLAGFGHSIRGDISSSWTKSAAAARPVGHSTAADDWAGEAVAGTSQGVAHVRHQSPLPCMKGN